MLAYDFSPFKYLWQDDDAHDICGAWAAVGNNKWVDWLHHVKAMLLQALSAAARAFG